MYMDFFGLRDEPFHITPDPEFLYLSPSHKEALSVLMYGVNERKGFISITGDVGLGKTTILRSYIEQVKKERVKIVLLFHPHISFKDLLRTIFSELELQVPETGDLFEMIKVFHEFLIEEYRQDHNVVIILDEAQRMPVETLEQLRLLSNLEATKDKLLQIILVGQTELDEILSRSELAQIKQRIAVRTTLAPLTCKESIEYISHRLSKVMIRNGIVFTPMATRKIVRHCKGIPRKINILCDNSLIAAFGYAKKPVSLRIVNEVIHDVDGRKKSWIPNLSFLPRRWGIAVLTILILSLGLAALPDGRSMQEAFRRIKSLVHRDFVQNSGIEASDSSKREMPKEQSKTDVRKVATELPEPPPSSNRLPEPQPQPVAKAAEKVPADQTPTPVTNEPKDILPAVSEPSLDGVVSSPPTDSTKIASEKENSIQANTKNSEEQAPPAPQPRVTQQSDRSDTKPVVKEESVKKRGEADPDPAKIIDRIMQQRTRKE